ncbi:hypothetical protein [Viridibacterium curvum]|uniref:Diguanylate cyclase n=1 Tax=Viridibacterium curvum TaxID=1101404 RepID=A0ABP9R490_9RHOO
MRIFDILSGQIQSVGLPLFAVSLAAIPRAETPLLLLMHWHGFRREGPLRRGQPFTEPVAVPSSALQLNTRWHALEHIETEVLDAAWQLGAWNLERDEKRACNTIGAPLSEAHACRQAFGEFPLAATHEPLVEEAPDRASLMQLAADVGYVCWQFRPVAGGIWEAREGDDTLDESGHRTPPCPVTPLAAKGSGQRGSHTTYRLGCINGLIY